MHLLSRLLPRQSANSPLDNRTPLMTNCSQAPDLEGIHPDMHGIAEQIRIINELNARLMHHLAHTPTLATMPPILPLTNEALLKIVKTLVVGVLHEAIIVGPPAITPDMGDEGKALKLLSRSLAAVNYKSQRAKRLVGEEDCLARMTIATNTVATYQPNKISRIWMPK